MKKEKIEVLIVDDERLAIEGIALLLQDFPEFNILGRASSISLAVDIISQQMPDLIFLDIQLQGETGFDLFTRTSVHSKVIFITAFDHYAVRAFEVNALDYLLKPVSRQRFKASIQRFLQTPRRSGLGTSYKYSDLISLNTQQAIRFTQIQKIQCITAEGDYTRVWIHEEKDELVLKTLKAWEALLPQKYFQRVHRSAIVNITFIEKTERTTSNRFHIFLKHFESPITMSQRYSAELRKRPL